MHNVYMYFSYLRITSSIDVWNYYTFYMLLAHGQWFSPGTPASSTTKAGPLDIAEILLKVALNTINQSHFVCIHVLLRRTKDSSSSN